MGSNNEKLPHFLYLSILGILLQRLFLKEILASVKTRHGSLIYNKPLEIHVSNQLGNGRTSHGKWKMMYTVVPQETTTKNK